MKYIYETTKEELDSIHSVDKEFLQECKKTAENYKKDEKYMSSDDVGDLLVRLYADYKDRTTSAAINKDYSKAVAIAIRMLTD